MAARIPAAVVSGVPLHYPAHLRQWTRLADGAEIMLRPIRPDDDALEKAFLCGLSRDSRYNRLLSSRALTPEEIRRLTRIDYEREMALVAVSGHDRQAQLLGVARYHKDADGAGAEFALVVADAWQRKGVGSLLLQLLLQHARTAGIARLHGITLASNQSMQMLARKLGFVQQADPQDATVRELEKVLTPAMRPAAEYAFSRQQQDAANDAASAPAYAPPSGACC